MTCFATNYLSRHGDRLDGREGGESDACVGQQLDEEGTGRKNLIFSDRVQRASFLKFEA